MEPLSTYFEIMVEEISRFPQPFLGIEASSFHEVGRALETPTNWEDKLMGFDDIAAATARMHLTFIEKVMAKFGRTPKRKWKPNGFDEPSLLDNLPHADYRRLGLLASEEQKIQNARLLPGRFEGNSVWQPDKEAAPLNHS